MTAALEETRCRLESLRTDGIHGPLPLLDHLARHMQDGFSLLSLEGVHLDVNEALCTMTGYERDELIGLGPPHPYWPTDRRREIGSALRRHVGGEKTSIKLVFIRKNGEPFPVRLTPSVVRDDRGEPICISALVTDLTEQQRAQQALAESEARYRDLVTHVPVGIFETTATGGLIFVNPAAAAIFGYASSDEMLEAARGRSVADVFYVDAAHRTRYVSELQATPGQWHRFDDRFRRKDGSQFDGVLYFSEEVPARGKERHLFGFVEDISELKRTEAELVARNSELQAFTRRLEELATTDALTGTYNRRKFNQLVASEIAKADRYGMPLALFILDLDHFKDVNDTYGHEAGDRVLVTLADLVRATSRTVDLVARWGGEEFVVLTPGVEAEAAATAAERVREAVAGQPFDCGRVTVSIGVANHHAEDSPDRLFARADEALYRAKAAGRNQVVVAG